MTARDDDHSGIFDGQTYPAPSEKFVSSVMEKLKEENSFFGLLPGAIDWLGAAALGLLMFLVFGGSLQTEEEELLLAADFDQGDIFDDTELEFEPEILIFEDFQ